MKITLLGTGTPEPSLKRQSSGYIVEVGTDRIILDNGPGAYTRLLQAGYKATDPTHVLFTHFHYDHFIEYPRIVLQHWDQGAGRVENLKVFGPQPLQAITDKLFGEDGAFSYDLIARTENEASLFVFTERGGVLPRLKPAPVIAEVKPGDTIQGSGWVATVGQAWHFQPQLECLGYRIETADGAFCYSGDSGAECQGIIELAKGADVLVHMLQFETATAPCPDFRFRNGTHLDVAKIAAQAQVGTLVATHIGSGIDKPGTRERLVREMAEVFGGTIVWGEDLMQIEIARNTVTIR